jgi:hypothetical protein
VTYSTFDDASTDVLRLDFVPQTVMADGQPLRELHELSASGYSFDSSSRVLRIRHAHARNIDVRGKPGGVVPALVTFDDPHLAAGTFLNGGYPSSQVDWGNGVWKIAPPGGQFATAGADCNFTRGRTTANSHRMDKTIVNGGLRISQSWGAAL